MKNKGFTLIELMIVIAIVGILASVALPMLDCEDSVSQDEAAQAVEQFKQEKAAK